jgi:glucose uptake protein GlcU
MFFFNLWKVTYIIIFLVVNNLHFCTYAWFTVGEELTFTPWGIVSGIMLVPGGMCGVYAVKNAGLATSQGIWSSLKVLVSFVWGMFIFDELVKSRAGACFAVFLISVGLVGMSYFSSPDAVSIAAQGQEDDNMIQPSEATTMLHEETTINENDIEERLYGDFDPHQRSETANDNDLSAPLLLAEPAGREQLPKRPIPMISFNQTAVEDAVVLQCTFTKRQLGLICAVFDGIWGGSFLVPLHFSKYQGLGFVISEAFGAMLVVIVCWIVRLGYNATGSDGPRSIRKSYESLPSMHFRVFWLPGILAGTLSSIGNIGAVLATTALGYSVGYPISHSSLLVSGLFGIFVYKEVRGSRNIVLWFSAALVTFSGMMFLSEMHEKVSSSPSSSTP